MDNYFENVLLSNEEKDDFKTKWYYGKIKNKECYGFIFNAVINGKNVGIIIPTLKDYSCDAENFYNMFKFGYKATVRMLRNASGKIG